MAKDIYTDYDFKGAGRVRGLLAPTAAGDAATKDFVEDAFQPSLASKSVCSWVVPGNGSNAPVVIGAIALTAVGTATLANVTVTNALTRSKRLDYLVTAAATDAVASLRYGRNMWTLGGALGGFRFVCRWGTATGQANSSHRAFCGMSSTTAAPTDVDPSTRINMVGMGWDAADTEVQFLCNDGAGTATKVALGSGLPKPSTDRSVLYELDMYAPPGTGDLTWRVTELISGEVATGNATTNIPVSATLLCPSLYTSVGGVSDVTGLTLSRLYLESDY